MEHTLASLKAMPRKERKKYLFFRYFFSQNGRNGIISILIRKYRSFCSGDLVWIFDVSRSRDHSICFKFVYLIYINTIYSTSIRFITHQMARHRTVDIFVADCLHATAERRLIVW